MRLVCSALVLVFSLFSWVAEALDFKLPAYQKLKFDNGLQVFLMPQKEVPLVHFTVAVQGGSTLDPENLQGLMSLTAEALKLGSKNYKKDQIEQRLDFLGAELESSVRADLTSIELSAAAKDVGTLIPLLADLVTAPSFPESEIIKLKERTISELKKAKESPRQLADQYFAKWVFAPHPYGRSLRGSTLSVSRSKRADFVALHKQNFRPERMAISVAGDFDPTSMEKTLRQAFGNWKPQESSGESVALAVPDPKPQSEPRVLLVNKSDATETTFRIGGLGVPRNHQDWIALQVINTILGGRFTSLLNEALRIKSGLTYGAWARFEGMRTSGSFAMGSFTASENSFKAIDLALETYKNFLADGFDQKALDSAKAYVKGQFPPRYETLESLSQAMLDIWAYQLPDQAINGFAAQVDALTLEKSRELIKSYFPAKNLSIVLIGKSADLFQGAQKYGRVTQSDVDRIDEAKLF